MKIFIKNTDITLVRVAPSNNALLLNSLIGRNLVYTELIALDNFVSTLVSNGIWEKIEQIYVPSLFYDPIGNIKQAYINLKSSWGQNDLVYADDIPSAYADYASWSYGGLTRSTAAQYNIASGMPSLAAPNTLKNDDFHVAFYKIRGTFSDTDPYNKVFGMSSTTNQYLPIFAQSSNKLKIHAPGVYGNAEFDVLPSAENIFCWCAVTKQPQSDSAVYRFTGVNDSTAYNPSSSPRIGEYNAARMRFFANSATYGFASIGTFLTQNEMAIYKKALNDLFDKVLVRS